MHCISLPSGRQSSFPVGLHSSLGWRKDNRSLSLSTSTGDFGVTRSAESRTLNRSQQRNKALPEPFSFMALRCKLGWACCSVLQHEDAQTRPLSVETDLLLHSTQAQIPLLSVESPRPSRMCSLPSGSLLQGRHLTCVLVSSLLTLPTPPH